MKKSKRSKTENQIEIIDGIAFDELHECEVCKKPKYVSAKGICAPCFRILQEDRADPYLRLARLKKIAQSESGVIRFARRDALRQTAQTERPFVSVLEKQARHYEHEDDRRIERVLGAAPAALAAQRKEASQVAQIQGISDDLIASLRDKPTDFYQLSPRRFEEFVAAVLQRMGYETTLMPATRDKGRDVLAKIRLGTGTLLTIVQCKRNAANRPVGLEIVERFLWTIEHTDKASAGMIVTTSYFSAPVRALAHEFEYRLHLADFDMVQEWIGPLGVWQRKSGGGVWIPPSFD
jgi:HJR/Mrr/RecB family endonuclease